MMVLDAVSRLQSKHVKEKQVTHQKNIIELQEKLKRNQNQVWQNENKSLKNQGELSQ